MQGACRAQRPAEAEPGRDPCTSREGFYAGTAEINRGEFGKSLRGRKPVSLETGLRNFEAKEDERLQSRGMPIPRAIPVGSAVRVRAIYTGRRECATARGDAMSGAMTGAISSAVTGVICEAFWNFESILWLS